MIRIWAIIERDLRRFRRSPVLVVMSTLMPLVQLVVLGYAFGGKIKGLNVGIVDHDHGLPAVEMRELSQAIAANARTFHSVPYSDEAQALADVRTGRIDAAIIIPPHFSRQVLAGASPRLALVEDNTDQFSASALEGSLDGMLASWRNAATSARMTAKVSLAVVEMYPYVSYIQYLLPGSITLAIFVAAMIGGGIIYIDDKARGLHEGYLVTPVTKFELILGFTLSGAAKAAIAGIVLITVGSVIAGIPDPFSGLRLLRLLLLVVMTSLALISMMFLIVVRVSDPLLPRALFGMLNTLLFFPSGAVYPQKAFPGWMRVLAKVDPFTYAVHGFKELILKNTGLGPILPDLAFLAAFTVISMGIAIPLFRRTL